LNGLEPRTGVAAVTPRKRAALTVAVMALCVAVASIIAGTWIGTLLLARVDAELTEHTRIWRWHASRRSCNFSSRSVGMISLRGGKSSLQRFKPWARVSALTRRKLAALTVVVVKLRVASTSLIAGAWIGAILFAIFDTVPAIDTRVQWGSKCCARNFGNRSVLMSGALIPLEAGSDSCVIGIDVTMD
jgi:hypothetical protein